MHKYAQHKKEVFKTLILTYAKSFSRKLVLIENAMYLYRVEIYKKPNIMQELEIGQKVTWTVGVVISVGVVLDYGEVMTDVICHSISGIKSGRKIQVLTELLVKI